MKIDITQIRQKATDFLIGSEYNYVRRQEALHGDLVGLQIFDEPLFAVGDAHDPLFLELRRADVIHPDYWLPDDWNGEARSVLSYFLPFTAAVRKANAQDMESPCPEWLHGRIEGQRMLNMFGEYLLGLLEEGGYTSTLPSTDSRFGFLAPLVSNWSERHTGFICGMGTFGLSKGLITPKGMAGRMGSIITSAELPVTPRNYVDVYEHCIMCGICERNCPAHAIDASRGKHLAKDHGPCEKFVDSTKTVATSENRKISRYGCGKCQVRVPCESRIPKPVTRAK